MNDEPIYPDAQARLWASFSDFDKPIMGPADVQHVHVTVTAPDGTVVVNDQPMSWLIDEQLWVYLWTTPADAGGKTFHQTAVLTALDGGRQPVFSEVHVDPAPAVAAVPDLAQPPGVEPLSRHWIEPWCDKSDIPPARLSDSNGAPIIDVDLEWMCMAATEILYHFSGRKYRRGRSVVRPTVIHRALGSLWQTYPWSSVPGYGSAWGFPAGWAWSSVGPGFFTGEDLSQVVLIAPITRVNEILLDGAVLGPDQYTVQNRRRVVLKQGAGSFPWQQNTQVDPDTPGTCRIDYEWGPAPPSMARLAAAELSTELALSFSGQDSCKLPARVQSIVTQGTNVAVGDALEFLKECLTGLPICDGFLQAVNPLKRRKRSVFLAPNSPTLNEV